MINKRKFVVALIHSSFGDSLALIDSEKELLETQETFPKVDIHFETDDQVETMRYIVEHNDLVTLGKNYNE